MSTQSSLFQLANIAGFTDLPDSLLVSTQPVTALRMGSIQFNTDLAVNRPELFYCEVEDGDVIPLFSSPTDGYVYKRTEQIYFPEIRSTVDPITGLPAAPGGLSMLNYNINQTTGEVKILEVYYVQGGQQTNTTQGVLGVWVFAQRGRGYLNITGTPTFSPMSAASLVQDHPLTQGMVQQLNDSSRAAVVKTEVFILNSSGAGAWTANTTIAPNSLIQPNYGHENGFWYEAIIVYGKTGTIEPTWPAKLGAQVVDGGVVWVAVGQGAVNGQILPYPVSPVDGYTYSGTDQVELLPYFIITGLTQNQGISLGPSQKAYRIQRLQKSASGMTVSCTVTYWNGSSQVSTNDGLLGVIAICRRHFAGTITPTASSYTAFTGQEFDAGRPVTDTNLQDLNTNINFAFLRPEVFVSTGLTNTNVVPVPTSSIDSYLYNRAELLYPTVLNDTGSVSGDYALRDIIFYTDPVLGQINTRMDYYVGGNPQTSQNGTFTVCTLAYRKTETLLDGVSIIPTVGSPSPIAAGTNESIIPNGNMELWSQITTNNAQLVGLPDGWSYIANTVHGFPQQIPGGTGIAAIQGLYSLALAVGHGGGSPSTSNYIEVISAPGAVVPGDQYSFLLQYEANPAISQGLYVIMHFRDINQAELASATLISNGAVPLYTSGVQSLSFKFWMPTPTDASGGTKLNTDTLGLISLSATLTSPPVYIAIELRNFEPNVDSNIIFDNLNILHLVQNPITPTNTSTTYTGTINPLSQSGTSTTILVAASTWQFPSGQQVTYNSGSVNVGSYGTWLIYCIDPQLLGGAVTYLATQSPSTVVGGLGIIEIGIITIGSTGSPRVSNHGSNSASTNPVTTSAFVSPLTNPSIIIVGITNSTGTTISTPTDTAGNTYLDCGAGKILFNGSANAIQLFYAINTNTTASNVISVANGAGDTLRVVAAEFMGITGVSPIDVFGSTANGNTGSGGGQNINVGPIITTINYDMVVGFTSFYSTNVNFPGSGFHGLDAFDQDMEYQQVAVAGPTIVGWNCPTNSANYGAIAIGLKAINNTGPGVGFGTSHRPPSPAAIWRFI